MSKPVADSIRLIAGEGVEGDVHCGATVKHLARLLRFASAANLRQVHLIHAELFDELRSADFSVRPGLMGENITTRGIDLLRLPTGARLHLGREAIVEVTGLRNPCRKLNHLQPGLMKATLARDEDGGLVRKAGVMAIVVAGGEVCEGDAIEIELPLLPYRPLAPI
ncbi:MAG TPA: MOSC domain-containing protein [Stellaceae bacterium]|nr:MOSC domain-containing protein [Stellaceae bacterium]